jgi:PII-like signaling protein
VLAAADRSAAVDQDCVKLTSDLAGRRAGSRLTADALADLCRASETAASIILRGTDGAGLRQHLHAGRSSHLPEDVPAVAVTIGSRQRIEAVLDQVLKLSGRGLVTLGQARLLSEDIDPVGLWDHPGEATKLTVFFTRQDRIYQVPAFEVICELLHRRGISGATVLAGIDGTFAGRSAGTPMMVTAVGSGQRLGLVLPELGGLLRHPLITLEQVRVCKRDGQLLSSPQAGPDTDADGRPVWLKLAVYACDSGRHDGQSMHQAISRRLHAAGIGGIVTLRGVWGFHGDHAPHGGRHVPAITIVTDTPDRVSAAFSVIGELTAERGLVTSEPAAAIRAANGDA